tara:strand:- start:711 stop:1217 length:507 start_codon:yes stop_codon:yes gene_type:complete
MKEKRNIPKQTGFKVPDNYFEDFKVDFSRNEVENSSTLETIKSSGFKTPENYLEDFKVEIPSAEKKTSKVISINRNKVFTFISTAAAVALFILFIYKEDTIVPEASELSRLAIEDYLEQNEFDFEIEIDYKNNANLSDFHSQLNTVDNEAILEYLSNNTDMTSFLNDE